MDAEAVIEQIEKLPPAEKRKVREHLNTNAGTNGAPMADLDELIADGLVEEKDGHLVITAPVEGPWPRDLVAEDRELRIRELMAGIK